MPDPKERITYWSQHRQLLGKQANSFEQVLNSIAGVYSNHPTAALSLFARTKQFNEKVFCDLDEKRMAFRVPAMRQSIYWLPKGYAPIVMAATLDAPDSPSWEKRYSQSGRKIPKEHYDDWVRAILKTAVSPMTVKELKARAVVPDDKLKFILNRMAFERKVLRVGAKSLRSNIISYVSTESWNESPFENIEQEKAQIWLAKKYLHAFGPARIKDFQWWAGINVTPAKAAFAALDLLDLGDGMMLLKEDQKAFEDFKIPPADSLDILPQWDSYIMGFAPDGRERFVSPDLQHHIYGKLGATGGNGLGTILVNGKACGSWTSRFKGSKMEVSLNIFEKVGANLKKDITNAFREIATLLQAKNIVFENKP